MRGASLVLFVVLALSACCTEALYGRPLPERTFTQIALLDPKAPRDTDAEGMMSRETCSKVCPHLGEQIASSCSPAELVTDHPDERIIVCHTEAVPRSFRFQELPDDVNPKEEFFSGQACIRICGAAHVGGCHLLPQIPIVEGRRFVVCRYWNESGCRPHVALNTRTSAMLEGSPCRR